MKYHNMKYHNHLYSLTPKNNWQTATRCPGCNLLGRDAVLTMW